MVDKRAITNTTLAETFGTKEVFETSVDTIVATFKKIRLDPDNRHSNAYAFVLDKCGRHKGKSGPCHGFIGRYFSPQKDNPFIGIYSITQHAAFDKDRHKETGVKFYDWVINRSPWAGCFINKDADFALESGVILRGDLPGNVILGALQTTRNIWEYTARVVFWRKLVEAGAEEHVAYLTALALYPPDSKEPLAVQYDQFGSDHHPLDAKVLSKDTVKNFRAGLFNEDSLDQNLWGLNCRYGPINDLFKFKDKEILDKEFWEELLDRICEGEKIKTNYQHPFTLAIKALEAHERTKNGGSLKFDLSKNGALQRFVTTINNGILE